MEAHGAPRLKDNYGANPPQQILTKNPRKSRYRTSSGARLTQWNSCGAYPASPTADPIQCGRVFRASQRFMAFSKYSDAVSGSMHKPRFLESNSKPLDGQAIESRRLSRDRRYTVCMLRTTKGKMLPHSTRLRSSAPHQRHPSETFKASLVYSARPILCTHHSYLRGDKTSTFEGNNISHRSNSRDSGIGVCFIYSRTKALQLRLPSNSSSWDEAKQESSSSDSSTQWDPLSFGNCRSTK